MLGVEVLRSKQILLLGLPEKSIYLLRFQVADNDMRLYFHMR